MSRTSQGGIKRIDLNLGDVEGQLNNYTLADIALLVAGLASVAVGGGAGDVTLGSVLESDKRTLALSLTGTLTGDRNVLIPTTESGRAFIFYNGTSGAFALTVKISGGTGVLIPQGFYQRVWHDGVNVYPDGLPQDSSGRVPQARVYNSADISIPNAAFTAVTYNSERYDIGGWHSTSSNTDRLVAPCAGIFIATFHGVMAANAAGARFSQLELGGATVIAEDNKMNTGASHSTRVNISTQYRLARADILRSKVYQDSGGALNLLALGNYSPEFSIVMVGH